MKIISAAAAAAFSRLCIILVDNAQLCCMIRNILELEFILIFLGLGSGGGGGV
jgi:hypothetical protein